MRCHTNIFLLPHKQDAIFWFEMHRNCFLRLLGRVNGGGSRHRTYRFALPQGLL